MKWTGEVCVHSITSRDGVNYLVRSQEISFKVLLGMFLSSV